MRSAGRTSYQGSQCFLICRTLTTWIPGHLPLQQANCHLFRHLQQVLVSYPSTIGGSGNSTPSGGPSTPVSRHSADIETLPNSVELPPSLAKSASEFPAPTPAPNLPPPLPRPASPPAKSQSGPAPALIQSLASDEHLGASRRFTIRGLLGKEPAKSVAKPVPSNVLRATHVSKRDNNLAWKKSWLVLTPDKMEVFKTQRASEVGIYLSYAANLVKERRSCNGHNSLL